MGSPPLMTGPIAPYNNVPIEPKYFKPRKFFIENISLGVTTTVTTTRDNDYVIGQLVRLIIPYSFGSTQLNEVEGYVLSIPAPNQVVLAIDSSMNVNQFILSSASTKAQILAIGDINSGQAKNLGITNNPTFIPGSFRNISPF